MRLELNYIDVQDVKFADRTEINNGTLYINRQELQAHLLEDRRLKLAGIELALPGERCRVLGVSDVIEPRAKVGDCVVDFPGALGKQGLVGSGTTCVLRGTAVLLSDFSENGQMSREVYGEIVDMSGPAAGASVYGKTCNIVVLPFPGEGVDLQDYRAALKVAGLKTAVYLARAGIGLQPTATEIWELPSLTEMPAEIRQLPRIVYVFQILSAQFKIVPGEPILYGNNLDRIVPTILHPNELLDGALTCPYTSFGGDTYTIQNHPFIEELYRRHGRDLCFAGVILTVAHHNEPENERESVMVANLARNIIGASGAILTKSGGGAPEIFTVRTIQRCEELGVKTAFAILQMVADPKDATFSSTITFSSPEADAMVSMGTPLEMLTLPPVERVIGHKLPGKPIDGQIKRPLLWIKGAVSQMGRSEIRLVSD